MSQSLESEMMEDLFYESAEGPARMDAAEEFEEFEEGEEEEFDALEEAEGAEDWAEEDAFEEYDEGDLGDAMEDAMADALGAEDTDEFFRRIARGVRGVARRVGRVARRVAPVVGRIARTVAPIASAIPLPQAQAIGRIAGLVGRVMADEGDEFEAFEDVMDLAEDEDTIDAAAPVVAAMSIRRAMPGVARLPRPARRQLVRNVTQATRTLTRRQGPQAARAMPRIVRSARRATARRGLPARTVGRAVQRTAARVARSPQAVRQLARSAGRPVAGRVCPSCGRQRRLRLRPPVRITIRGS